VAFASLDALSSPDAFGEDEADSVISDKSRMYSQSPENKSGRSRTATSVSGSSYRSIIACVTKVVRRSLCFCSNV